MPKIQTHLCKGSLLVRTEYSLSARGNFSPFASSSAAYGTDLELTNLTRFKVALLLAMLPLCFTAQSISAKQQSTKAARVSLGPVLTQE